MFEKAWEVVKTESRGRGKQKPHNYECGGCGRRVKDYKSTEASPRGTCDCPTTMMPNWLPIKKAGIEWVPMCPKCYEKQIPCVGRKNDDNWKGTLIGNRCFEMFSSDEAVYRTPEQFDNISRSWTPNRPWEVVE